MKKIFILLSFIVCFSSVAGEKLVRVGAYHFPPFFFANTQKSSGLTIDIIKHLNKSQSNLKFVLVETSPKRRYEDLNNGVYDVIFFESPDWSWDKKYIDVSNVFLTGGEVYIAGKGKPQSYFEKLSTKRIRLIDGYHYGFLDFSTEAKVLKKWNLSFTNTHEGNIKSVVNGESDIAVVTKTFLNIFLNKYPDVRKKITISKKLDQKYLHRVLIKKDSHISISKMNSILKSLVKDGTLSKIEKNYR